ncbi:co-chaperone DjlA [Thalassotalea agarivorans]|uniref:Co-chaperone protein DjlA n=1 Tax=Thalassotalea agarivorans TaxID=349064 RepID=A0A1I0FU11_THASX|nr:co-chaperone DjlA [Thalassotalea agarivorans]SET61859.1 DnaJ like chaperone protein [Thalassotalea agarivorans]
MQIAGKVLGFFFGLLISKGNIFVGFIGAWIGHRFDKGLGLDFNNLYSEQEKVRQQIFFYTAFATMGYIAKANGRVSEREIAFASAYMDRLHLNADQRREAQDAFREGKMPGFPLREKLAELKRTVGNRHDLLLLFMEIQIQVAFADGDLDTSERQALHSIAGQLGFSSHELDRLLEMIIAGAKFHQQGGAKGAQASSPNQIENAYKLLGVTRGSDEKSIKRAYRKLMSQHHPDKLIAKGLPEEMIEVAKQKTQDIQAAYELVSADLKR